MKNPIHHPPHYRLLRGALCPRALQLVLVTLGLACALAANTAKANSEYFNTATTAGSTYSWNDPNWSGSASGPFTNYWTNGDFARFTGPNSYIVEVTNAVGMAGMVEDSSTASATLTVNAVGSGNLNVVPGSLTVGLPAQGFFALGGQSLIVNAPVTGSGGVNFGLFSGSFPNIYFYGTNTYTGGSVQSSSSVLVNYNNSSSFGTGPINIDGTFSTAALFLANGGNPITLANNFTNANGTAAIDFGNAANTPVTCTGPLSLLGNNLTLRNNGNSTAGLTWSGVISGTAAATLTFNGNSSGTTTLSGANTYAGQTIITNIDTGSHITVSVSSLNKVVGGSASSSLGAPTTAAAGTIRIGGVGSYCTLKYTGVGETTDRVIDMPDPNSGGGAVLENDGSGPIIFTSAFTATGAKAHTLTLQGSNGGTLSGAVPDNSSANKTTVVKTGTGKWILGAANTYTGGTTVSNGTLEVSGSITGNATVAGGTLQLDNAAALAGNVTVNSGNLVLDNAAALSSSATVSLASSLASGSVTLSFGGQQTISTLVIGGTTQPVGTYGSSTSTANTKLAVFTGNGVINVGGTPVVTTQPVSQSVWQGSSVTFTVVASSAAGAPTYQWLLNGASVGGANSSSYTINPAEPANSGSYTCGITNSAGGTVSSPAQLTVRTTNAYTTIVLSDSPLAYWRLDEKGGSTAYDAAGTNNGTYQNVTLGVTPGYSTVDTDPCVYMPAVGSIVPTTGVYDFFTNASPQFTIEGWAYFTNVSSGVQRLLSCFHIGQYPTNCGYAFGISDPNTLEFSTLGGDDYKNALTSPLQNNVWYQLAVSCDGANFHFYLNGQPVGTLAFPSATTSLPRSEEGTAIAPVTLGAHNDAGLPNLHEQFLGLLDEVSIYGTTLPDSEILAHYNAAQPSAPQVVPVTADFPTNYITETTTFTENAVGQNLQYTWYSVIGGVTNLLSGPNGNNTYMASGLTSGNAGSYYCNVSNTGGNTNAPALTLTVLPIPTSPSQLNITNALVLHLPLVSDYKDISGYSNNAVAVGAPQLVPSNTFASVVGNGSFYFSSGTGSSNYATLGAASASLQFSTNYDFTIAFWINQTYGDISTNVPFFANVVGGFGAADGYCMAPGEAGTGSPSGAWSWSGGDGTHFIFDKGSPSSISDGNWHHLVFVFSRTANGVTYLDGKYVSSQPIAAIINFDTTNSINIGQDATGGYGYSNSGLTSAYMDDLGVWRRALSAFEVEGVYLAGISNSVSFAPAVVITTPPTPVTITGISGNTLTYTGGSGASQFILLSTNALTPPGYNNTYTGWTRVATNSSSAPKSFTISTGSHAAYYVIQSK